MVLLLLIVSFSMQAMEVTSVVQSYKFMTQESPLTKLTNAVSSEVGKNALVSTIILIKNLLVYTKGSEHAYGLETGIGKDHEPLQTWIEWQLTGQMDKLLQQRKTSLEKGTRLGKREAVTLEHMINKNTTKTLSRINNGTKEQAEAALKTLYAERELYEIQSKAGAGVVPTINSLELFRAEQLYQERFGSGSFLVTRNIVYETSKEIFADMDISKFKNEEAFVVEAMKRVEHMKDMGLFKINKNSTYAQTIATVKSVFNAIDYSTRRFQEKMAVSTATKLLVNLWNSLWPFFKGKSLQQNLHDAVYNRRPHLGYKLQILYAEDIAAFADVATDCMLMIENEINATIGLVTGTIDMLGNFVIKLDEATEKIYTLRKK